MGNLIASFRDSNENPNAASGNGDGALESRRKFGARVLVRPLDGEGNTLRCNVHPLFLAGSGVRMQDHANVTRM